MSLDEIRASRPKPTSTKRAPAKRAPAKAASGKGKKASTGRTARRTMAQPYSKRPQRGGGGGGGGRGEISLYVGNLPFNCSWQDLKDSFKPYGCEHSVRAAPRVISRTASPPAACFREQACVRLIPLL